MDHKRIIASLNQIKKMYGRILDNQTLSVTIPQAISSVKKSKELYDKNKRNQNRGIIPQSWGYTIDHRQPLRFNPAQHIKGIEPQIDIYCQVLWAEEDIPIQQDIKVRIWSKDYQTTFQQERDAQEIKNELTNPERDYPGRVLLRFHFDRANPAQYGPQYHLQIGGKPEDYELCWHPKKLNLPRLNYHPLELVLTCQMIVANFFPTEYQQIRQKPEWRKEILWYQQKVLQSYYEKCQKAIKDNNILLDTLWNV